MVSPGFGVIGHDRKPGVEQFHHWQTLRPHYGGGSYEILASGPCASGSTTWYLNDVGSAWYGRVSSFQGCSNCNVSIYEGTYQSGAQLGPLSYSAWVGAAMNDRTKSVKLTTDPLPGLSRFCPGLFPSRRAEPTLSPLNGLLPELAQVVLHREVLDDLPADLELQWRDPDVVADLTASA